jgi:hypothetical protein
MKRDGIKYKLQPEIRKYMKDISKIYGVKLKFEENRLGGVFYGDTIVVGLKGSSKSGIISVFCHELGHYILWQNGKYSKYHNPKYFGKIQKQFQHYGQLVRYCLNAEIATEKKGKDLCKEWFPTVKYKTYYKDTKLCYEFLYGYYFRG